MLEVSSLPAACVRSLRAASARDHQFAESHRRSSERVRTCAWQNRASRIRTAAHKAAARAADLLAEAR